MSAVRHYIRTAERAVEEARHELTNLETARDNARLRCNSTIVIEREMLDTQRRLSAARTSLQAAKRMGQ